jgi:hypothetical protein
MSQQVAIMTSQNEHRTGPLTQTTTGLHRVTCQCGWSSTAEELDGLARDVTEHMNPGLVPGSLTAPVG